MKSTKPTTEKTYSTLEMDGYFKESEIVNKDKIVIQCRACRKWSTQRYFDRLREAPSDCICGANDFDRTSIKSLRTYRPMFDNKRKPK